MHNEAKAAQAPVKATTNLASDKLPALLHQLREHSSVQLKQNLQQLFTSADDTLFGMADRATSNNEQNALFEAMRSLRLQRKNLEQGFIRNFFSDFNSLVSPTARAVENITEHNIDNLSLIQHDELEEAVAIDTMVAKVIGREAQELKHLTARFGQVLNRRINDDDNPMSPSLLSRSFLDACTILGLEIQIKLIILKLFEKSVLDSINELYTQANKTLIAAGVLPNLSSQTESNKKRPSVIASNNAAHSSTPESQHESGLFSVQNQELQQLLAHLRSLPQQQVPADAIPISTMDLMRLLSHIQQHSTSQYLDGNVLRQQLDSILERASKQSNKTRVVGEIDNDIINLVSMLFDFILDDQRLPHSLKALIGRLQIPLLKAAVLDKNFFGLASHPARRLLNEIGAAAVGWSDQDNEQRDNLYQKIEEIVQRLLSEFTDDPNIFNELLADFIAFTNTEKRRSELLEQRIRDAEEGRARADIAREQVEAVLNQRLLGQTLPQVVVQLLQDNWSKVLLLTNLKFGDSSEEWRQTVSIMDQLIWSVGSYKEADERNKQRKLIPRLLDALRQGFSDAALDPFATSMLLTKLEVLHVRALQRHSPPSSAQVTSTSSEKTAAKPAQPALTSQEKPELPAPADSPEPSVPASSVEPVDLEELPQSLQSAAQQLLKQPEQETPMVEVKQEIALGEKKPEPETAAPEPAADASYLEQVDALHAGGWFEWQETPEQDGIRCKLAAIIKSAGKYIFVNRRGIKVLEKSRNALALALKDGSISMLDDGLLFDRALESVIGDLRRMKNA